MIRVRDEFGIKPWVVFAIFALVLFGTLGGLLVAGAFSGPPCPKGQTPTLVGQTMIIGNNGLLIYVPNYACEG